MPSAKTPHLVGTRTHNTPQMWKSRQTPHIPSFAAANRRQAIDIYVRMASTSAQTPRIEQPTQHNIQTPTQHAFAVPDEETYLLAGTLKVHLILFLLAHRALQPLDFLDELVTFLLTFGGLIFQELSRCFKLFIGRFNLPSVREGMRDFERKDHTKPNQYRWYRSGRSHRLRQCIGVSSIFHRNLACIFGVSFIQREPSSHPEECCIAKCAHNTIWYSIRARSVFGRWNMKVKKEEEKPV